MDTTPKEERSIVFEGNRLSVIGHGLEEIPESLGAQYSQAKELDLSYNSIKKVTNLEKFTNLKTLILDNNQLDSQQTFPKSLTMQTLWLNNNNISDLKVLLDNISKSYPNLTYLSMLKNPACPNYFNGNDFDDYQRYRYYVLYRVKTLKFLDSSPVTEKERKEAARVGPYMIVAKPDPSQEQRRKIEEEQNQMLSQIPNLPSDLQPEGKGSARFGVTTYVYYGKHSEGNRFIMNEHL
mmetsp:Transcript_18311/g.25657  ORF Transcript_18311/g.25657 Transcript_18311/m.25657 type:complete len:237 (-) Transcript_18311:745-1455(-)|eukprot:CAMPEP_0168566658 /NCGR_PEP_ID=MMETSP0413-20121227/14543_1 /TAXON_ID=136452 /ORGANISM="Filamoeba nolandi, Strain NC-AS-23-1" /LENGTH=236 /DNA_ID=CAMNT_0008598705 /DNA_START=19 /DNA_END=729 /DNA_ORIENTATION=-